MAKVLKKKNLAEEMRDRTTGNNQSYKVVEEQKTINPGNLLNKIEENNQSNFQNRVNQLYQQNMQMTNLARTPLENLPDNVKQQAKWIGNKAGVGVQLGVLGLGSAGLTDVANQLRKGEESSKEETKFNLNNSLLLPNEIANIPGIIKTLKESKENAPKDETITQALARTLQDSVSIATDMLPFKSKTNAVIQTIGNLFKEKTGLKGSDILLKGNEEIRKPTEKYSQRLEEEGQNYNPLVQLMGNAAQSVGNMTPSIAASVVLPGSQIASLGMMGASVKGNSTSEMLKKGEDLQNAIDRGNTDAAIEIGTELLTGGVNIFGKGALDDILNKNIIQKVDNEVARFFVKQGVDIAGENLEETISDILGTILDKGTTDPDAKYTKEEWTETQLTTILTTTALKILTGGLIGDINMANNRNQLRSEVNENTNLNETERENLNRKIRNEDITNSEELQSELKKINEIDTSGLSEDRVKSLYNFAERNNLSLDEVRQLVEADQQRFNLETNTEKSQRIIDESNLSEDEKKSISRFAEKNNLTLQETENLIKDTLDSREIDQKLGELPKEQAQDILREANSKDLSFEDTKKLINEQIEENNVEQEAQRQLGLNLESFEKDGNTYYKEKQNIVINDSDTLESSFEKYYGKNETKTLKSVKNLNEYAKTVGTSIIFDANTPGFKVTAEDVKKNPKLKGLEGTIKTNVEACFDIRNGKRVIVINPYAKTDKTIQRIISHELTHNVLGNDSNEAKQLMKTVENYWINKYGQKEYNKIVNELKESYGENYNDEELTAKTIEQLFTSEESLTDLANSNPNIFTRIYSKLVGMYAKLTGSEKAYVKKMKLDMELAWKNSKNDTNLQDTVKKYSFGGENAKTANIGTLKQAKELKKQGLSNEEIFEQTGWFEGNEGKWRFEIDNSEDLVELEVEGEIKEWERLYAKSKLDENNKKIEYHQKGLEKATPGSEQYNKSKEFIDKYTKENEGWKRVVGDTKVKIDSKNLNNFYGNSLKSEYPISDILKADKLYEAYPQLKDLKIRFDTRREGDGTIAYVEHIIDESGKIKPANNYIYITKYGMDSINNGQEYDLKKTLLHELQHKVQDIEGFSRGTSWQEWYRNKTNDIRKRLYDITRKYIDKELEKNNAPFIWNVEDDFIRNDLYKMERLADNSIKKYIENPEDFELTNVQRRGLEATLGEKETDKFYKILDELKDYRTSGKALEYYKNTAGEIESREVEKRVDMTPDERANELPFIKDKNTVYAETMSKKPAKLSKQTSADEKLNISTQDSQGRKLTKEQQEYFKDVSPELKDEDGNLKVMYHSTPEFRIYYF